MSFDLSTTPPDPKADPAAYRLHMRDWLAANVPATQRADTTAWVAPGLEDSIRWENAMYRAGLVGMTWPKEYGGQGHGLREHLAVNKEIGSVVMPESVGSIAKELAGPIIMAVGTEEQKLEFLPRILSMEHIWCQGFSEPEAGSDLARLRTRAVREGDSWRINGQKIWTSFAMKSQYCFLLTRTGTVADRHKGMVMFIVPMDTPGIRVVPIRSIDNVRSFAEVFFDDVVVPDSARLGAPDEGWNAAIQVLSVERATNRMYRAWRNEADLKFLIRAMKSDSRLKDSLNDSHARAKIGQLMTEIDGLKGLIELAVDQMETGAPIGARGSLSKLYWSEIQQSLMSFAMEMLAPVGATSSPLARRARDHFTHFYLASRAATIYAGASEVQRDIIAQRILNLPTEVAK